MKTNELGWPVVIALALLHAILFFASFHPLALFPLAWVAFAPFAVIVARGTRRQAYLGGFLATAAGGGASVFWLSLFGPEPWAGTAFGFGLYGLFMVALARPMARRLGLPAVIWLPLVVCAQELCRGHLFFWAFPWVFLGHSQYLVRPLIQSADLGGAILLSFVMAALSGALADAFLDIPRRTAAIRAGVVAAVVGLLCVYGAIRERSITVIEGGPRTLCVQSAVPQDLKDETAKSSEQLFDILGGLTVEGASAGPVDLYAWPETMVMPRYWNWNKWHPDEPPRVWPFDRLLPYAGLDLDAGLRAKFRALGERTHASAIVGSLHVENRASEVFEHNAAFFIAPDGTIRGRYDKMYPAPMSEYTPFQKTWPALYHLLRETFVPPGFSQFEPGEDVPVWEVGGFKVAASVCFDITFPAASNLAVKNGADAIVNVSNYAWFKNSAELDLARVQTIFRAIETRRGVVSCCNGGISTFVDPRGRAEDVAGGAKEKEGTLVRPLTTSHAWTLFVAAGDWCGGGSTAAALALALFALVRKNKESETPS